MRTNKDANWWQPANKPAKATAYGEAPLEKRAQRVNESAPVASSAWVETKTHQSAGSGARLLPKQNDFSAFWPPQRSVLEDHEVDTYA
jgi:hypothetical protein